ncbi:AraC family transcriptional regulator [Rhodopirellula halodulae]|uniref:AraC family transcriptional regulator n=1 Tax=Rhodopirellula halodulae TaxID=2894198 RepID=UPI001E387F00|nr:AraC family transcriptional regulator [Rhodopirellula sp. JC737]MCC9658606.1 AraC family transcriptional regulator [Rhodopirellula sp. JC737]
MMHSQVEQAASFFSQFRDAKSIVQLFDFLPNVCFYAKDAEHRYIAVNRATLAAVFNLTEKSELLGRTDREFQPPALAEAYHAEDRRVMDGRTTIANQVWLVPHVHGMPRWYVSTKTPLFDDESSVVGIAGVMYPIETPEDQAAMFQELGPVVQFIGEHYTDTISMKDMAEMAELSSSQFNQRFQTLLRMSPSEFVLSLRVDQARQLLIETEQPLAEVAAAVGFYDQSHFTKRFRRVTGMTPRAYRKRFREQKGSS